MTLHQTSETPKAVFTVSIDFELMWGTADRPYAADFRSLCEVERRQVVVRLLALLEEFDIPATWGVVGQLFLRQPADTSHPSPIVRQGPDELYHCADLVERIQRCKVAQDIGSHTFCHIEMDEAKCSPAAADADIAECARVARQWGIEMRSLIFPRNLVGNLQALKRHGFTCYRGPEPHWYARKRRMIRRLGHLLEILTARTPPSVTVKEEGGLWNIPGSMLYTPSHGTRRYLPVWLRVLRARRGLDHAVRRGEIFHLWFHPTDLAGRADAMLYGLRRIFEHAASLRQSGRMEFRSMRDLTPASSESSESEAHLVAC
jgi:peptidoglycan/xylan/chitin deacetylase (PgdA/CDA1 family)